jgi:hypothetical protein
MGDCIVLEKCIFFNDQMPNLPNVTEIFKRTYCRGNQSECARLMVRHALGGPSVPATLYPNQKAEAQKLIESVKGKPTP